VTDREDGWGDTRVADFKAYWWVGDGPRGRGRGLLGSSAGVQGLHPRARGYSHRPLHAHSPPRAPPAPEPPPREDVASLGNSVLVLNTGRSKGQLMELLQKKEDIIAVPDVLITAVGTKVRERCKTFQGGGGGGPADP
jgi:hypothetical protein